MKLVIVAKTNAPGGLCIGALGMKGESLRLLNQSGSFMPYTAPYEVGDVWDIAFTRPTTKAPHIEDIIVSTAQRVGTQPDVSRFILGCTRPWVGGVKALFDGKLGFTGSGSAFIGPDDVPSQSTGFWMPDSDLTLDTSGRRYEIVGTRISYVGAAPAVQTIKARTLVRVSLARWWKPADADEDFPERCYLQVSGWY